MNIKLFIKILAPFLVVLYTCFEVYFNNVGEVVVTDILQIILVLILIVLFMIIIFMIILKNIYKSVFIVTMVTLVSLNFKSIIDVLQPLLSNFYYWHFILLFIYLICLLTYIFRTYQFKEIGNINSILSIVFAFFILSSTIIAFPKIIDLNKKLKNLNTIDIAVETKISDVSEKPNFYYIIFDEYGGYENLKYFFNYDNHDFYNKVKDLGFNVSYSSNNRAIHTIKVVPDLVNLKFIVNDNISVEEAKILLKNPVLVQLFKNSGYKLNKITNDEIGVDSNPEYLLSQDTVLYESVYTVIMKNTFLYPFFMKVPDGYIKNMQNSLRYLYYSVGLEKQGILSIAHFNLPHNPFIFNKNGDINPPYLFYEYNDNNVYLNYLEYCNNIILNFIKLIKDKDPMAVVLIQSDHGARPTLHKHLILSTDAPSKEEIEYMKSVLNILYFKGEKINIEGLSGYDTLKLVVDKILNTNLYEVQVK